MSSATPTGPMTFVPFPKIARLRREIIITEKIDGTNAGVHIDDLGEVLTAASRNRWIAPGDDGFGFASWVAAHADELRALGPGMHWGEWWGAGIQRRYGLAEKRWSLFNVSRWTAETPPPACCHVVPTLYRGPLSLEAVDEGLRWLRADGSLAAPGFMKPEGVVVFHVPSGNLYKQTIEKDDEPKGRAP